MAKSKVRDSGIELLKIFAMMIVVSCHVVQTLTYQKLNGSPMFHFDMAGQGITITTISALLYNGAIGNCIFFACSAWFLVDNYKMSKRKILNMILDVWVISVIVLVITYIINRGSISSLEIIKNLLPTTYQNNWYVTCYILFYAIHPLLNQLINRMNQQQHFRMVFAVIFIYYFWSFFISIFMDANFFGNPFILWIVLYFVIAYIKKYMPRFNSSLKTNILLLVIGIIGNYGLIFGTDIFKSVSGIFTDKLQFWNKGNNPFIVIMTISLLNIAKEVKWRNTTVNYISSLTLFIYVIHENWFVRSYLRPYMWQQIYDNFGYDHIILWIVAMTLFIFIVSMFLASLYKSTLYKLVIKISNRIYDSVCLIYGKLEKQLLKLK